MTELLKAPIEEWLVASGACLLLATIVHVSFKDYLNPVVMLVSGIAVTIVGLVVGWFKQGVLAKKPVVGRNDPGTDLRLARRQLISASKLKGSRDPLTGLNDQLALEQIVEHAIGQARRHQSRLALIAFDIDRLKDINGCFGFEAGDTVLIETAKRLNSMGADIAVKLSGDRFVVLFSQVKDLGSAEMIGATCLERIGAPIQLINDKASDLNPSASAGIAVFPDHGTDYRELFQHAEMAVDHAKRSGGRRCCLFEGSMIDVLKRRRAIEHDLKHAIEREQLHLVFQPQIDLSTGIIFGAEALMRWQNPDRGAIPPTVFIPVAEATGLIRPLGGWLIEEACRCAQQWKQQGLDLVLAINISTAQLRQNDLIENIDKALSRYRLAPGDIELELTESLFVDPAELMMRRTLDNLARMGVNLAIDDFGTGFSSLAYLKRLPVSKIKIDKSFITGIGQERVDEALIRTIINLGKTFDKTVLAEGVENEAQLRFLRDEGCHQAQGYYFARPLSFEACSAMVKRQADKRRTQPGTRLGMSRRAG